MSITINKDGYELLARVINRELKHYPVDSMSVIALKILARELSMELKRNCPNFKADLFLAASLNDKER